MEQVIIIRYSEIHLKGDNRGYFEKAFVVNMEKSLKGIPHVIRRQSGRYLIEDIPEEQLEEVLARLKKVFGIHSYSVAYQVPSDMDSIFHMANAICRESGTFKVDTHRADKTFPLNSVQVSAEIGGRLLANHKNLKVDVHDPQFVIHIDMRENGKSLIFNDYIKGAGGMPIGTAGKGLLLISGGIDSPVAGQMIARRGMKVNCLHFHSYPYTNMQAKEKVVDLAKVLAEYTCGTTLSVVSVTHIQEEIHKKCNGDYMVTLLRRFMMRIAERLADKHGEQCIITGESLGQVASQTVEGMTSSNSVVTHLPVLRPLCGFDKDEIIERSREMGTYEISILPYEDCCTVFLPRHPVIKPKMADILAEEAKLDVEALIEKSLSSVKVIEL